MVSVSDNFDERIDKKIFHAEIVMDNDKVAAEAKAYKKIPEILSFVDSHGEDKMKQEIEANYRQIKLDIVDVIESELKRIKNDSDLQHLVQSYKAKRIGGIVNPFCFQHDYLTSMD